MSIELRRPLWLLILIPLVAGTVIPFILAKRKRALRGRHNVSLVLRLTAVVWGDVATVVSVLGLSLGRLLLLHAFQFVVVFFHIYRDLTRKDTKKTLDIRL